MVDSVTVTITSGEDVDKTSRKRKYPEEEHGQANQPPTAERGVDDDPNDRVPINLGQTDSPNCRPFEFISARAAAEAAISAASMLDSVTLFHPVPLGAERPPQKSPTVSDHSELDDGNGTSISLSSNATSESCDVIIKLEARKTLKRPEESPGGVPVREPDDEEKKIFVGGLHWETTEQDLFEYFGRFGSVNSASIKFDALSGHPRGFGFVVFDDEATVDVVLNRALYPEHWIKGKPIEPKRAKCRPMSKKIFVGGLDFLTSEEQIKRHFERFGNVLEVELPCDHFTGRRREFGFVVFDSEDAAERASYHARQWLGEREVDVKRAMPQPIAQHQKRLAAIAHLELSGVQLPFGLAPKNLYPAAVQQPSRMSRSAFQHANEASLLLAAFGHNPMHSGTLFSGRDASGSGFESLASSTTATNLATQYLIAQASLAAAATAAAAVNSAADRFNTSYQQSMAPAPPQAPLSSAPATEVLSAAASVETLPSSMCSTPMSSVSMYDNKTAYGQHYVPYGSVMVDQSSFVDPYLQYRQMAPSSSSVSATGLSVEIAPAASYPMHQVEAPSLASGDEAAFLSQIPMPNEQPEETSSKIAQELLDAMKTATAVLSTAAGSNSQTSSPLPKIKQEDIEVITILD